MIYYVKHFNKLFLAYYLFIYYYYYYYYMKECYYSVVQSKATLGAFLRNNRDKRTVWRRLTDTRLVLAMKSDVFNCRLKTMLQES